MKMKRITMILSLAVITVIISSCTSKPPLPPLSEDEMRALKLLGGELTPDQDIKLGEIIIHRRENEVSFPARINMWDGDLEIVACTPAGRMHESLFDTEIDPLQLQLALILSGAKNGSLIEYGELPQGTIFDLEVEYKGKRVPVEKWIYNLTLKKNKERWGFVFIGSSFNDRGECMATKEGNIIDMNSMDLNSVLHQRLIMGHANDRFVVDSDTIPKPKVKDPKKPTIEEYTMPVRIFLIPRKPKAKSESTQQDGGQAGK